MTKIVQVGVNHCLVREGVQQHVFGEVLVGAHRHRRLRLPMQVHVRSIVHPALQHGLALLLVEGELPEVHRAVERGLDSS